MSLFFGTTEITKLRDLAPQSGLDITELWFGSTNVYTVWQTYEGTLPATFNANGADMRQYQIYGITGGVGDRTENLFDYREYVYGYYISNSGVEIQSKPQPGFEEIRLNHSSYISVSPNESYTMKAHHQSMNAPQTVAIAWYDENKTFISRDFTQIPMKNAGSYSFTATAPQNTKFAIFNFFTDDVQGIMFVKGTALPETYVPFGYKLDMGVKSGNLFDKNATDENNGYRSSKYLSSTGTEITSSKTTARISEYIKIPNTMTKLTANIAADGVIMPSICLYDGNKQFLSGKAYEGNAQTTINVPANAKYCRFSFYTEYQNYVTVIANTITPIYIGDEPLDKDEYVDYGEQKIYRMINSTLTPTDPPVALPALPTCEGKTVIDYAGESVAPEKVLFKYRKKGF